MAKCPATTFPTHVSVLSLNTLIRATCTYMSQASPPSDLTRPAHWPTIAWAKAVRLLGDFDMANYQITEFLNHNCTRVKFRQRIDSAYHQFYSMAYDCLAGQGALDTETAWRVKSEIDSAQALKHNVASVDIREYHISLVKLA